MRHTYLKPRDNSSACRGGVMGDAASGDYEVEIGGSCKCSARMLSLMAHHDEIIELLTLLALHSPMAALLLNSIIEKKPNHG